MASLDAKLADRRRQRALESKERQQKIRNSRKAFKDQLDSNAPTYVPILVYLKRDLLPQVFLVK